MNCKNYKFCSYYTCGDFIDAISDLAELEMLFVDGINNACLLKFKNPVKISKWGKVHTNIYAGGIFESPFSFRNNAKNKPIFGNDYMMVNFHPEKVFYGNSLNHERLYLELKNYLEEIDDDKEILSVFYNDENKFIFDPDKISDDAKKKIVTLYLQRFCKMVIDGGFCVYSYDEGKYEQSSYDEIINYYKNQFRQLYIK